VRTTLARRSPLALLLVALTLATGFFLVPDVPANAAATSGIYVSMRADRTGGVPLAGRTVSGYLAVYWADSASASDTSGTRSVEFAIDGKWVRTEAAPYDFASTRPDGQAVLDILTRWGSGARTISAKVFRTNGTVETYRASFTALTSSTASISGSTGTVAPSTTTTTVAPLTTTTPPTAPLAPLTNPGGKVPRFAPNSFWYHQIPGNVALNPLSAAYVSSFNAQWKKYYNNVGINTTNYAPPIYVAAADTPTQKVRVWDCQRKGYLDSKLQAQFAAVPIPPGTKPSPGTDAELVIHQPSTDTVWEMWVARYASDGVLEACWGGKLTNVSQGHGIFPNPFGTTATGLSLAGGIITPEELKAGRIDHALSVALVETRKSVFSWPANRTDGWVDSLYAVPEGLRFRLDPTINVDALQISRTAKIVAKAVQTYGMVVRDKSGAVTFYAENVKAETGSDPYPALFGGAAGWSVLNGIPWDRLQALPFDYGKP
jgi:hypothetical protein